MIGAFVANRYTLIGLVAGMACFYGSVNHGAEFFPGYLQAFGFWGSITVGALGLVFIHALTGGKWGEGFLPLFKAGAQTLPFLALLFVPIVVGMKYLYPWSDAEVVAQSPLVQSKIAYLNPKFFLGRAVGYFVLWFLFSRILVKGVERGALSAGKSGVSLLFLAITFSFAAFDWFMSIEPEWFSSLYGGVFIVGSLVSSFSFFTLSAQREGRLGDKTFRHDAGKLLLMSVMLWAYLNFSQYLIIWSGQLPEEMVWYHHRMVHGWNWVGLSLIVGLFFIPFLLLLSRRRKENTFMLLTICTILLLMRIVDFTWLVAPGFGQKIGQGVLWKLVAYLGVGGIWLGAYTSFLRAQSSPPSTGPQDRGVTRREAQGG